MLYYLISRYIYYDNINHLIQQFLKICQGYLLNKHQVLLTTDSYNMSETAHSFIYGMTSSITISL